MSIAKCAVFTIHYFLGQIDVGNFVSFIYARVYRIHFVKKNCLPPDTQTYVSESEGNNSFMENFAFILDRGSLRSSFWKFFGMINIVFMKFVITFWWVWDGFYVARTNPCFTTKRGYWFCVGVTLKIYIYKWINFTINKLSIY